MRSPPAVNRTVVRIAAGITVGIYHAAEIAWQAFLHRSVPGGWRAAIVPAAVVWIAALLAALVWRAGPDVIRPGI